MAVALLATTCLSLTSSSSSVLPISTTRKTTLKDPKTPKRFVYFFESFAPTLASPSSSCLRWLINNSGRVVLPSAVLNEETTLVTGQINDNSIDYDDLESENENDDVLGRQMLKQPRPCEVYVCNIPRRYDIPDLLEMFKPFGTILSVEISRNPGTGVSRGCGYVTMSSINSAKNAINALDGSDVDGREMRVRFAVEMSSQRNPDVLNATPKRSMIYESPYKLYVGNLHRAIIPEHLRDYFSQYGTVVSAKVLHDQKGGKSRVFGFLSFSSAAERNAAISANGSELYGRKLVVREGIEKDRSSL